MDIATRLEAVRINLKMSKKEFSDNLNITTASYFNYVGKKRQIPTDLVIVLNQKYQISTDWLLLGNGDMYINDLSVYINKLDTSRKKLLSLALGRVHEHNEIEFFFESIEEYYIFSNLKLKFNNIGQEYTFFKKLISGKRNKNSFILIFAKALKSFNADMLKSKDIREDSAKIFLLKLVSEYELKLIEDRAKHLLTDREKRELISWIEIELSDLDTYVILKNIPEVLDILREEINFFNKKSV